jgi:prepilin-type processing-associated H-X9-DG protein
VLNGDQPHKEGKASFRLSNDGLTTLSTKEVDLAAENPFTVTGTMDKPGILSLDVDVAAQPKRLHKVFGAAFEPFKIEPGGTRFDFETYHPLPKDFKEFWNMGNRFEIVPPEKLPDNLKRERVYKYYTEPQLTPLPRLTNDKVEGYKVSFQIPSGHIYGFLTIPKAPGKYPAIVSVPGAGPGATSAPMLEDFVYLVMNVHTYDPDIPGKTINDSYKEVNEGGMYMYKNIPDREKTYFHHSIIGICQAVRWLSCHDKVDSKRIGYHGSSQGGAFGLILGGIEFNNVSNLCAIVCNVPALCDHLGYKEGRLAGWPQFCRQMNNSPEIEAMALYYDAANFARFIPHHVPVHVIVGLADRTCSPSSVYAAYNQIPSLDKKIISEVGMGHEVWPSYHKEIAWLKDYLKTKDYIEDCINKLKMLALATNMFLADNNKFPDTENWPKTLNDAFINSDDENFFKCPNGEPYHYNRPADSMWQVRDHSSTILFFEDFDNHDNKVNIAFTDGHVMTYPIDNCKNIEELAKHYNLIIKVKTK